MASPELPHSLETISGKFVDLIDPDPSDIIISDIAWSLSRIARFNGFTIEKIPYSVAQHSCVVADLCMKNWKQSVSDSHSAQSLRMYLLGLLHDASEAYTGDISGPLKKIPELRSIIKPLEHTIQLAIYAAVDIAPPTEDEEIIIKKCDILAQRIEAYNFMVSRGNTWCNQPTVSLTQLQDFEHAIPSLEAYKRFEFEYVSKKAELHQLEKRDTNSSEIQLK